MDQQTIYTTRLAASKLVDRSKASAVLWALEHGIGGKRIAHQAKGLKLGAIQIDFQDCEQQREHDGNEEEERRGFSRSGILQAINGTKNAQPRNHPQNWPRSPLHAVFLDVSSQNLVSGRSAFKAEDARAGLLHCTLRNGRRVWKFLRVSERIGDIA
ncbi:MULTISPECIES: hypothetical protein [Bradyrhizobium]|uniref:Uncharacterized protein n=1 Tax=Bradyrhizobium vignae TaxID=1549949 RepID=A0A2U3Q4I8_9BRAD|nr:hypothetical protein [Bradyrhizobium vignae]MBP0115200.1 hypothetical protein [Bradyrhizobium vignae]SPP96320.1 protein of unknown function [Bradyrhizobium vignae]